MRPVALTLGSLLFALGMAACAANTSEGPAPTPSASPSAAAISDDGNVAPASYDHTLKVSPRIKVEPDVTNSFSEVDIANAKNLVNRWVSDLVVRPRDILKSGGNGYDASDFEHLRPYMTDDLWDTVLGNLPGARRSARVTADVPDAKSTDADDDSFFSLVALDGYGLNTPGQILESSGLIEPTVDDIRFAATDYPNAIDAYFTVSFYGQVDSSDPKTARSLAKEKKDVPDGADGAYIELDRRIGIYRDAPGDAWLTYNWRGIDSVVQYVVLSDAIGS